jgi:RHS repeat-associated protein
VEYLFTGKQVDAETGWYNFGARYLDPKTGIWLSSDPALGEYIPRAPLTKEDKEANGKLPGNGGIYNPVNFALYHFAGNNPIRYVDPDGRDIVPFTSHYRMGSAPWGTTGTGNANPAEEDFHMIKVGCYVTSGANAINTLLGTNMTPGSINDDKSLFPTIGTDDDKSNVDMSALATKNGLRLDRVKSGFLSDLQARSSSSLTGGKDYAVIAQVKYKNNSEQTHYVGVNSLAQIGNQWYIEIEPSSGMDTTMSARKDDWLKVESTGKVYVPVADIVGLSVLSQE